MTYLEEGEPTKKRTNYFLYFAVIIVNLTCFTCGIAFSWSSPVVPKLSNVQDNSSGILLSPNEISWLVAFLALGAAVGPFLGGFLADKLGRKPTFIVSAIPFILVFVLIAFGSDFYLFGACRFVKGMCVGLFLTLVPMYVGEIAEVHNRGILGCFTVLFITLGMEYSFSVGPYISIKWFSLSCTGGTLIFLVLFTLLIPESPCYLIVKGKQEEARRSLQKLRCTDVEDELKQLLETVGKSSKAKGGIAEILKTKHLRKSLFLGVGLMMIQQSTAISVINFYMQLIFENTGTNIPSEVSAMIIGAVQIFGAFLSTLVVDRLGRRPLLLVSTSLTTICLLILSIYFYLLVQVDVSSINWLPITTMVIYMIFYNLGIGPLAFAVMGEIYPPHIKSAACSISVSSCYLCSFIAALLFPFLSELVANWFAYLVFAIGNGLGVVFIWFCMPETKGKTLLEIVEKFK